MLDALLYLRQPRQLSFTISQVKLDLIESALTVAFELEHSMLLSLNAEYLIEPRNNSLILVQLAPEFLEVV